VHWRGYLELLLAAEHVRQRPLWSRDHLWGVHGVRWAVGGDRRRRGRQPPVFGLFDAVRSRLVLCVHHQVMEAQVVRQSWLFAWSVLEVTMRVEKNRQCGSGSGSMGDLPWRGE
jgi:hypothetical protein